MGLSAHISGLLAAVVLSGVATAQAQENLSQQTGIAMELSTAEAVGAACKLSFVVTNPFEQDIDKAVYETVLFDGSGQVSRLTLLDFQDLPAGRLRVRQFQFPLACGDISQVLINGADICTAEGLPDSACSRGLILTSRTEMEFLG
ncbi:hypothetical protein [Pseudophaeobacter sp.]|uniref:hypothetical protein n=1 Tax=Pseudophaeobacter sp. TaxID=1971739 RepID=UPI004058AC53